MPVTRIELQSCIQKAIDYVYRHARPVDAAELAFHLGQGSCDVVLNLLSAYQNPDGGFGHAIEPDVRCATSTVLATTVAMQRMVRVQVNPYHPMVLSAIRYLVDQYELTTKNWPLVNEAARAGVCAPWWKKFEPGKPSTWSEVNPRAEILSYFLRFDQARHGGLNHQAMYDEARRVLLSRLAKEDALEMHEVQSVARLLRSPGIDGTIERTCREALERDLPRMLPKSVEQCRGYVLKPLTIARRPNSVLSGLVESAVNIQHEFEVTSQRADGSWDVPWNWSEVDAGEWAKAEVEWRGMLTMLTASSLSAYARQRS